MDSSSESQVLDNVEKEEDNSTESLDAEEPAADSQTYQIRPKIEDK